MFRSVCSRRITSTSRSLQLNLEWVETEQEQAHLQNIPPPAAAVPRPIKPATANICQHGVCCILKVKERILSTLSTSFTFTLHSTMTFFKTQKPLNSSNASAFWSGLSDQSIDWLSSHTVRGWKDDLVEDKLQPVLTAMRTFSSGDLSSCVISTSLFVSGILCYACSWSQNNLHKFRCCEIIVDMSASVSRQLRCNVFLLIFKILS